MDGHPRYSERTVEWGHWRITFMDVQADRSKNFGEIVGSISFPVANGCGPQDGLAGSPVRQRYQAMCDAWCRDGMLPETVSAA